MKATPSRPLRGMTVVVLDGHRDTVDMLEEYLSACGATVVAAVSAKAALALAEAIVLDAALVDMRMPGEDGRWFLRELRSVTNALGQRGCVRERTLGPEG